MISVQVLIESNRTPACDEDSSFGAMKFSSPFDLIGGIDMADYNCPAPHEAEKIVTIETSGPYPTPFSVTIPDLRNEDCGTVMVFKPESANTEPWEGPCRTLTHLWDGPEPTTYTLGPEYRGPEAIGTAIVLQPGATKHAVVGHCSQCVTVTKAVTECPTPVTLTIPPSGTNTDTIVLVIDPSATDQEASYTTITRPLESGTEAVTTTIPPSGPGGPGTVIVSEPVEQPGITTITVPVESGGDAVTTTLAPGEPGDTTTVIVSEPNVERPGFTTITVPGPSGGSSTITVTLTPQPGDTTTVIISDPAVTPAPETPSITTPGDPEVTDSDGNVINTETIPQDPTDVTTTTSFTPTFVWTIGDDETVVPPGQSASGSNSPDDGGPTGGPETPSEEVPTPTGETPPDDGGGDATGTGTGDGGAETGTGTGGAGTGTGTGGTTEPTEEPDPDPVPVPDTSCGNSDVDYALFRHEFTNSDDTYSTFDPTFFYNQVPFYEGVTDHLGIRRAGNGAEAPFMLYDDTPPYVYQYVAVIHEAYFYAPVTGEYTVSVPAADDITMVWFGSNAYFQTWNRDNALITRTYHTGLTEAKIRLKAGTLTPFRLLWANGQQGYDFRITVFDPNGRVVVDPNVSSDGYFIRYGCDAPPPPFPPYGTVEIS